MTTRNPQRGKTPPNLSIKQRNEKNQNPKPSLPSSFPQFRPSFPHPLANRITNQNDPHQPRSSSRSLLGPQSSSSPTLPTAQRTKAQPARPGPSSRPFNSPFLAPLSICSFCPGGQGFSGFPQTRVPRCKPPLRNPPPLTRHRSACFNTEPLPATPSQPPPISEAAAPPTQPQPTLERAHHKSPTHSHPPTIHKVT